MADGRFISMDFPDEERIIRQFDARLNRLRRRTRDIVDDLADFGVVTLRGTVPVGSKYLLRHVDRTPARWQPGGGGGGGAWVAVFGVKTGSSRHPLYVEFGTGLYGALGWYIVPNVAPYLVFRSSYTGRLVRKRFVRGQKAQRYFYSTWLDLQVYARTRLLTAAIH